MAKVTGPNLSIGSHGQVGKTLVSAKWKGVPYVRQYVKPSNPKTTAQQSTRSVFSFLSSVWKLMAANAQAAWVAAAKGMPLTDRNQFIKSNLPVIRGQANLHGFVGSPGSGGGLLPDTTTVTGGVGTITVAATAPALPAGWTVNKMHALAITEQNPSGSPWTQEPTTYYAEDASDPYTQDITVPAGTYSAAIWFSFTKPDGSIAYGPSVTKQGTAT